MPASTRTSPAREVGRIADRLHSAAIHLLRRLRIEDEALGLSAPRLSVLSVLVFAGAKRIGELARIEQVEPPTMTRLVDGLVRATPAGRRTLQRGRARRLERLEAALRDLSPAELRALGGGVDVLERVLREP